MVARAYLDLQAPLDALRVFDEVLEEAEAALLGADLGWELTERVLDRLPGPLKLVGVGVDYVVEAPRGAWPTSCYPDYALDGNELLDYVEACNADRFDAYLERFLSRSAAV